MQLPYITCPGNNVTTVITSMGIFRKEKGKHELRLCGCLPDEKVPDLEERIKRIKANCGWPLAIAEVVEDIAFPAAEELKLLRRLSPGRT